jgi:hypothetical protein
MLFGLLGFALSQCLKIVLHGGEKATKITWRGDGVLYYC